MHAEDAEEDDETDPVDDDDGQGVGRHPGVRAQRVQSLHLHGRHQHVDCTWNSDRSLATLPVTPTIPLDTAPVTLTIL